MYFTHSGLLWSWPFKFFSVQIFFGFFSGQEWKCLPWFLDLLAAESRLVLLMYLEVLEAFKIRFYQSFWYHSIENCMLIILVPKYKKWTYNTACRRLKSHCNFTFDGPGIMFVIVYGRVYLEKIRDFIYLFLKLLTLQCLCMNQGSLAVTSTGIRFVLSR